jgi:hypothetical protein
MTDKQPEALRLADVAQRFGLGEDVAVELRRLHEENKQWQDKCNTYIELHDAVVKDSDRLYALNAELVGALRRCAASLNPNHEHTAFVFAALAKAEGK